jgi:hypothetical protein
MLALGGCKADTSVQGSEAIPAPRTSAAGGAASNAAAGSSVSNGAEDAGRNNGDDDETHASADAGIGGDGRGKADVRLRDLVIQLSGMESERNQFVQFRVIPADETFAVICVIHEGLRQGTHELVMPRALLVGEDYRLDFWVDHDGSGGYDAPPTDHAWSLVIPSRGESAVVRFAYNDRYVHIEQSAPIDDQSLVLSAHGMYGYLGQLFDVQVTESANGRLVGRQIREVPGDSFDLTVASVIHEGVAYHVDLFVDDNADGEYDAATEPGWRLESVAIRSGLHIDFTADPAM